MGAWDLSAFGNDDAADWSFELQEADDFVDFLQETLALAEAEEYLESPDGSEMIAAAAVVAAAMGAGTMSTGAPPLPEDLKAWLKGKEAGVAALAPAALLALQRVRAEDSELRELWEETDEFAAWGATLDTLATALGKPN